MNVTNRFARASEVLEERPTDASGWARFEGLAERYPDRELGVALADDPRAIYASIATTEGTNYTLPNRGEVRVQTTALGGADRRTLSLVFVETTGVPVAGADVYIYRQEFGAGPIGGGEGLPPPGGWGPYWNGTTDAQGFYLRPEPLGPGEYTVRVARGGLNATDYFGISAPPSPLSQGPDGVLAFVGLTFLPLILPIMALVLAYDAVARERAEGTLDLLLSKPVDRMAVALGKLTGALASMALPAVAVLLTAAGLLWARTGQPPTGGFLAALLGEALLLLFLYTSIFLAISALVRGPGTALLFSILFYPLFGFFWGLVSFLVATLVASPGSVAWFQLVNLLALGSPTGVYQQLLAASLPGLTGGLFGGPGGGATPLAPASVGAAALLWALLPLLLFLWTMKYRVTEG